jgi:hypothetical protein
MVTIPESYRTLPGLGIRETRALVFVVREFRRRELLAKENEGSPRMREHLSTLHVRKHLKISHPETMNVVNRLRILGMLKLQPRNSLGMTGNGYDGAIWGALTPSQSAFDLVDLHFPNTPK